MSSTPPQEKKVLTKSDNNNKNNNKEVVMSDQPLVSSSSSEQQNNASHLHQMQHQQQLQQQQQALRRRFPKIPLDHAARTYSSLAMALVWPVTITMCIIVWAVLSLGPVDNRNPIGTSSVAPVSTVDPAFVVVPESPGKSTGEKIGGAILNMIIVVAVITVITFIMVVLYKYGYEKVLYVWLGLAGAMVFFFLAGLFIDLIAARYQIPYDYFMLALFVWNFGVVGLLSVFYMSHPLFTQCYLIVISVIVAWGLTQTPEWTTWMILLGVAIYDILAVLCPKGPLNLLVKAAQERQEPIPGFIYDSDAGPAVELKEHHHHHHHHEHQQQQQQNTSQNATTSTSASASATASSAARPHNPFSPTEPNNNNTTNLTTNHNPTTRGSDIDDLLGAPQQQQNNNTDEEKRTTSWTASSPNSETAEQSLNRGSSSSSTAEHQPVFVVEEKTTTPSTEQQKQQQEQKKKKQQQQQQKKQQQESDSDDEDEVDAFEEAHRAHPFKLGLGDFIFYSLLVGRAALSLEASQTPWLVCYVCIIGGMGATLASLLFLRGKVPALPALPFSIFAATIAFFVTRYLLNPYWDFLTLHAYFP